MMSHIKEEQISAYIDRQLSVDENRSIEIHLEECSSCRAVYDELSTLTQLFQDSERIEPPVYLWNRIAADFNEEHPAAAHKRWVDSIIACLRGYSRSWGMAAATIVVFLIAGIVVYHGNRIPVSDRAALAQLEQINRDLAAQDPDGYNPFASGAPGEWDSNPFKSMRLNNKTYSVPPAALQH
jgi:predicted anti-sigma-YlaC factor YlaD